LAKLLLPFSMSGLFSGTPLERPVTCEQCSRPMSSCNCPRGADGKICTPADQRVRVHLEKRRGAWVTIVRGLDPVASDAKSMVGELKKKLAAGGTPTGDGFELQGNHREAVLAFLIERGYPAKPSGG